MINPSIIKQNLMYIRENQKTNPNLTPQEGAKDTQKAVEGGNSPVAGLVDPSEHAEMKQDFKSQGIINSPETEEQLITALLRNPLNKENRAKLKSLYDARKAEKAKTTPPSVNEQLKTADDHADSLAGTGRYTPMDLFSAAFKRKFRAYQGVETGKRMLSTENDPKRIDKLNSQIEKFRAILATGGLQPSARIT